MSKTKFAAAREFIDAKQYDEARMILHTIDHPTAKEWLSKIDRIAPVAQHPQTEQDKFYQRENRRARRKQIGNGLQLIAMGVGCFVLFVIFSLPTPTIPGTAPRTIGIEIILPVLGVLALIGGVVRLRGKPNK